MEKHGKKRTLVECYDRDYLENTISLLCENYDAVTYVYFGHNNEPARANKEVLSHFLREKCGLTPEFLEIRENTVPCALHAFDSLITGDGLFDFDITGGSSVFIAAAGALLEREGGTRVSIHEYDPVSGACTIRTPEQCPAALRPKKLSLSISDIIALQNIDQVDLKHPVRYDLGKDDLRGEISRLWEVIRGDLHAWNTLATIPTEYVEGWTTVLVQKRMNPNQYASVKPLMNKLKDGGILSDLRKHTEEKSTVLSYRLAVPESARFLYEKGGNILELLTYLAAEESALFSDCCTGMKLDWMERPVKTADPYNEIDAIVVRNHIPFFISCKNAAVKNDYLYEILTMTRHFGGKYARPVLVSTMHCSAATHTRAEEMGVILISGIRDMTAKEYQTRLAAALTPARAPL